MSEGYSWLYTCGFCCLYPLLVHFGIVWLVAKYHSIDWSNVRLPWRRND